MEDTNKPQGRDEKGRILPGSRSLNPGGIRRMPPEIVDMLKAGSGRAAQVLVEALDAMRSVVVPGGRGEPSSVVEVPDVPMRVKAADILHCRLYGKPLQEITGEDGQPLFPPTLSLASLSAEQLALLDSIRQAAKSKP
jgi:hypothetical protein